MIKLQIELLTMLLVGYLITKKKIVSKEGINQITNLVINIFLPCSVIVSFQIDINEKLIINTVSSLVCACLISLGYYLLNLFVYKKLEKQEEIMCKYGTMVTNASFVGLPIINSIFGSIGVLYTSIFVLPQRILMWTYGLKLFFSQGNISIKKVLFHPCVISVFIGLLFMILKAIGIRIPIVIEDVLNYFSKGVTSLCMIVIGSSINEMKIKNLFKIKTLYYCLIRLIVCPLLIILIFKCLPLDNVVKTVCVLMSGMPAPTTLVMLAKQYNYDVTYATSITLSSTILSMLTLPIIYSFALTIFSI